MIKVTTSTTVFSVGSQFPMETGDLEGARARAKQLARCGQVAIISHYDEGELTFAEIVAPPLFPVFHWASGSSTKECESAPHKCSGVYWDERRCDLEVASGGYAAAYATIIPTVIRDGEISVDPCECAEECSFKKMRERVLGQHWTLVVPCMHCLQDGRELEDDGTYGSQCCLSCYGTGWGRVWSSGQAKSLRQAVSDHTAGWTAWVAEEEEKIK